MRVIRLAENNIVGEFPPFLTGMNDLQELDLSGNTLLGSLPQSFSGMGGLQHLNLGSNRFAGNIPEAVGELRQLKYFNLSANKFDGSIPNTIQNLKQLEYLDFSTNRLSNKLPGGLWTLTKLKEIKLQENILSAGIAEDIEDLVNLEVFWVSNNKFSGEIPQTMNAQNLPNLYSVHIDNNEFEKDLPVFMTDFSNPASSIQIDHNRFIFNDFISEFVDYNSQLSNFKYIPQDEVDNKQTITANLGATVRLSTFQLIDSRNEYQWYKYNSESEEYELLPDFKTKNRNITINNFSEEDYGTYRFIATNEIVEGLELTRRVISIVRPSVIVKCNILEGIVDGDFNNCNANASRFVHNQNIVCSGWINGDVTTNRGADTWRLPIEVNHTGISKEIPSAVFGNYRNGNTNVFAGAVARALEENEYGSFHVSLTGIKIGQEYELSFFQLNGTGNFDPNKPEEYGRWKVEFGTTEPQYSSKAPIVENPKWNLEVITFTANESDLDLKFTASSGNNLEAANYVYMMIDNIRLSQVDGDGSECFVNTQTITQAFCTANGIPLVSDLVAPNDVTDVVWYSAKEDGYQFLPENELTMGGPDIPAVDVYWAESSSYSERQPVKVLVDENVPNGFGFQQFGIGDNPTIADLVVEETLITWYDAPIGGNVLPSNTLLEHEGLYFASKGGSSCRLEVEVYIETPAPEADPGQDFCASDAPTVGDLVATPTKASNTISWFDTPTGGAPLSPSTLLEDGATYYASQDDGFAPSAVRAEVTVSVFSLSEPQGESFQVVYAAEGTATVRDLTARGTNIQWYDSAEGGTKYLESEPLVNRRTYYASQEDFSGICNSVSRLSVTVEIKDEIPPQYFSCEKFKPNVGDTYVISGWVRQDGLKEVGSVTKNFDEVSGLFQELLTDLAQRIVDQVPTPEVYVPSAEDRIYDPLVPFIKTEGINNLTIYNLLPIKQDQDLRDENVTKGIIPRFERTIGFSFSFDPEGETEFIYKTPVVFDGTDKFFHIPMILGEDNFIIGFDNPRLCNANSTSICIRSNLQINSLGDKPSFNAEGLTIYDGFKSQVEFFSYTEDPDYQVANYADGFLKVIYTNREGVELTSGSGAIFRPQGQIIEGWQKINTIIKVPNDAEIMTLSLQNDGDNINVYFDDIRMHPFDSNMKTFVYDPYTQRLQAELDENNYATFYEYDKEGGLIRVKKETERGIYTIQETRSSTRKSNGE